MDAGHALDLIVEIRTTYNSVKFNRARCNQVVMLCNVIDQEIKRNAIPKSNDEEFLNLVETLKECRKFLLKISKSGLILRIWRSVDVPVECDFYVNALETWLRHIKAKIPVAESDQFSKQDAEFKIATRNTRDRLQKAKRIAETPNLSSKVLEVASIQLSDIQFGSNIDHFTLGVVKEGLYNKMKVYLRMLNERMEPRVLEFAKKGVLLNKQLKDCSNILPIHGICDGRIVVTGASSHGLLSKFQYDLSILDKIAIARKIATAVFYIHQASALHRDIRACNILLDDGLEPMLTGFELSREIKDPTGEQEVEEHVRYWWSPDKKGGGGSSRDSDVYSFGVLMYEISMQKEPETGDTKVLMEEEMDTTDRQYSLLMGDCLGDRNRRPTMEAVSDRLLLIESGITRGNSAHVEP
ncbi:hypothetical protein BGZ83_009529 [Gryganskiella cystojenkinii]|nr:hypothetical protein BGZ83_009529 [Gryganskiella cystojenkinii]